MLLLWAIWWQTKIKPAFLLRSFLQMGGWAQITLLYNSLISLESLQIRQSSKSHFCHYATQTFRHESCLKQEGKVLQSSVLGAWCCSVNEDSREWKECFYFCLLEKKSVNKSFGVCARMLRAFYHSEVSSAIHYTVVCWGASSSDWDRAQEGQLCSGLPLHPMKERRWVSGGHHPGWHPSWTIPLTCCIRQRRLWAAPSAAAWYSVSVKLFNFSFSFSVH